MNAFTWCLAALSVLGVILNVRRRPICFACWLVTSGSWAVLDWQHGLPAQAALQATYFVLSLWGLLRWRAEAAAAADTAVPPG